MTDEPEWKTKARKMHFEDGLPPASIGPALGFSVETVRKFLHKERKTLGKAELHGSHSSRAFSNKVPLSPRHVYIGAKLAQYRNRQPGLMTATQLGLILNMSRLRIREMELGYHDFTLTECEKIAKLLKKDVKDLIR